MGAPRHVAILMLAVTLSGCAPVSSPGPSPHPVAVVAAAGPLAPFNTLGVAYERSPEAVGTA